MSRERRFEICPFVPGRLVTAYRCGFFLAAAWGVLAAPATASVNTADIKLGIAVNIPGLTGKVTWTTSGGGSGECVLPQDHCTIHAFPGDTVTFIAAPGPGTLFEWKTGPCFGSTSPTCTVSRPAPFAQPDLPLGIDFKKPLLVVTNPPFEYFDAVLGQVTRSSTTPPVIDHHDSNYGVGGVFNAGTTVTLTAVPGTGVFEGWGRDCSGTGSCTVVMNADRVVEVGFARPVLRVVKDGTGGSNSRVTGPGIDCGSDCEEAYDRGTSVTLGAAPGGGAAFRGFSGACSGPGCTLSLTQHRAVTASFHQPKVFLTKRGRGLGAIASRPALLQCDNGCATAQAPLPSAPLELTATPAKGSRFAGWSGPCGGVLQAVSPTSADTCRLVNGGQDVQVTATFEPDAK